MNCTEADAEESYLRDAITELHNTVYRLTALLERSRQEIRELIDTKRCLKDSGYVGYNRAADPLRLEARRLRALLQNTRTELLKTERILKNKNCHIVELKVENAKIVEEMQHSQNWKIEEQNNKLNEQNVLLQEQNLNITEKDYEFQEFQNDVFHRMDTMISNKESKDRNVTEAKDDDGYLDSYNVTSRISTNKMKKSKNPHRYTNINYDTKKVKQESTTKLPLLESRDNFDIVSSEYSDNNQLYQSDTNKNDTATFNLNIPLPITHNTQFKKTRTPKVPQIGDVVKGTQRSGITDTWPCSDVRVPNRSSLDISRSSSFLFSNNALSLPPESRNEIQRAKLPPISPRK